VRIQIKPASQWAAIGNAVDLCSGGVQSKLGWNIGYPNWDLLYFPSFSTGKRRKSAWFRLRLLPFKFFSVDDCESSCRWKRNVLATASLNKQNTRT